MRVLLTGGAGYIGTHVLVELLSQGHEVVVVDNYSNSHPAALKRVEELTGRALAGVFDIDIRDRNGLADVFRDTRIDTVVHLAAKKSIAESMRIPVEYYDNNVGGTAGLLSLMGLHGVRRLVFSSSCSIYGNAEADLIGETAPVRPLSPYATSKAMSERILDDACGQWPDLSVVSLRYFNPIGAHPSGLIGESPQGPPNNLVPNLVRVAAGQYERVQVFGHDYPTPDGTAIRDYIHIQDVVDAHMVALERLDAINGVNAFNLGTGVGTSVLELISVFSDVCGRPVPYEKVSKRPGDAPRLVADPTLVSSSWGWQTARDLATMCVDAWRFQQLNPYGLR